MRWNGRLLSQSMAKTTDSKPQRYGTIQEITINDEADKEQNKIKMQVAIYYKNQH